MGDVDTVTIEEFQSRLRALPENPRVVISGNMSVPWEAVRAIDAALPSYTIHALNGQSMDGRSLNVNEARPREGGGNRGGGGGFGGGTNRYDRNPGGRSPRW